MNKKRDAASPNEGAGKKSNVKSNPPSPSTQPQGFLSKLWAATSNNVVSQDSGEESSSDESTQSVHSEIRVSATSNTPREMVSYAQATNTSQDARRIDSPSENNQRGDSKPNENLPIPSKKWTLPKYSVETDGPIRQRLEVEFRTLNGKPFKGTITPKESKHEIFHKILGFEYSNFYGARPAWKNGPTITFTFCEPTNVDDLAHIQDFTYERHLKVGQENVIETIGCHIKGLRGRQEDGAGWEPFQENWVRIVKIEGCEYQVSEIQIKAWLSHYGELLSPIVEDCFEDSDIEEGVNAMGIYSVKMRLKMEIPQVLPMCGKRVKIYYKGIDKLCTKCFGKHPRRVCKQEKVPWIEYVEEFVAKNADIPPMAYGRWTEILAREKKDLNVNHQGQQSETRENNDQSTNNRSQNYIADEEDEPSVVILRKDVTTSVQSTSTREVEKKKAGTSYPSKEDFIVTQNLTQQASSMEELIEPFPGDYDVPVDDDDMEKMIEAMTKSGMRFKEAEQVIKNRKKDYNDAIKKYKAEMKKKMPKKDTRKTKPKK
jgi:hypothetical protein